MRSAVSLDAPRRGAIMAEEKQAEKKQTDQKVVDAGKVSGGKPAAVQRKIAGNLPYLSGGSGTLKRALERLIAASRPDKFNADYLENILKLSGGTARATIPILKKTGFLSSEGVPTDLYAKFRTVSGRGPAALQALRNGFPEIFKRSEYAHNVDDTKLRDIIVEITGLKGNDPVAQAIKSTFNVVKAFVPAGLDLLSEDDIVVDEVSQSNTVNGDSGGIQQNGGRGVGLVYNINIVLPETSDLKVLNAIFRSVKENLL
jgi:hypothetical protein